MENPQDAPPTQETQETQPTTETSPVTTEGEKTFTQAELEKIISSRLTRDRDAQSKQLFESVGIGSIDELKSLVESKKQADAEKMTELEKAQAQIAEATKGRDAALAQVAEMQATTLANGRKSAFNDAVRNSGATQEKHLFLLMQAEMGDAFKSVFEDGTPKADEDKMKSFVKDVQAKFPMYFGTAGAGSPSTVNGISPSSKIEATKEAATEVRKFKI